jgi:glutathione S-transferase
MNMLQLYGNPRSRAMRCLWMLEEMGEPYQLIEKTTRADDLRSADYRRLNPNARIPTLVDGDLVLWESMAINLYLAQKYEGPMHCAGPEVLGVAAQWSFWGMLEMEALLLDLLTHRAVLPEFARDPSCAERDELLLERPLGVLNSTLAGRDYLVSNGFTVADLNVAAILVWGKMGRLNMSGHAEVARWFDACLARPAYGRVRDRASRK